MLNEEGVMERKLRAMGYTGSIRLLLNSACPDQELFRMVAVRLDTS